MKKTTSRKFRLGRYEEGELFLQAVGALAIGSQQKGESVGVAGGFGDRQAQRSSGKVAPVLLAAGGRQGRKAQDGHEWAWLRSKNRPAGL